jgi:hypothetical protein
MIKELRDNFTDIDGPRRAAAVKVLYEYDKASIPSRRAGD